MNNPAQYPYLIVAPDYSEASAGIQVLHFFCQTINNSGGKAWIVGGTVNPTWNTPRLTEEEYAQLQHAGEPWIAVYPEVTSGNPLRAPVVARYMLNREGVMNGNRLDFSPDDLFFWYRVEFAEKEYEPALLNIENYNLDLFQDDNPHKDLDLLYINRLPASVIEYDKLPKNLTVLSMQNPLPLEELAKVLKRGRVLYTYESSGTCLLANLCGCPVVGLIAPGYENYALSEKTIRENGNAGYTLVNTPESIENARQNLYKSREQLLLRRERSLVQFGQFIEKTQRKAQEKAQEKYRDTFQGWLENRVMNQHVERQSSVAAMLFVILNVQNDHAAVDKTVASLRQQLGDLPDSRIVIVEDGSHQHTTDDMVSVIDFQHYQHHFTHLVGAAAVEWLQVVPAGVIYTPDSLYSLSATLSEVSDVHAIYADEAIHVADSVTHFFKPEFNLDLFLSAPSRYLKRIFFRVSAWLECGGWDNNAGQSFELDLISKFISRYDIASVGHYPDIVAIVEENMLTPASIEEEGGIVGTFAAQRNLPVEQVEYSNGIAWRVHYKLNNTGRVSIVLTNNNDANLMTRCIASLVDNTEWQDYEIIIPVISGTDPLILQTAREVEKLLSGKVKVLEVNHCTEVQAVNIAAAQCSGESLLFLDVRSIFVLKSWLNTLLNPLVRPEVACVGPKIISFDKKLISAGMVVGADNGIANVGTGEDWQAYGYQARYQCEQNYSVLNDQCLLIKKECFVQAGGLDEKYASLEVSSAAFCLALQAMGYVSVWSPFSVIATDNYRFMESEHQQALLAQTTALIKDFSHVFANDPAYSRHLSLSSPLYTLDTRVLQNRFAVSPAQTTVLLVQGSQTGYAKRLASYFRMLEEAGDIQLLITTALPALPALLRANPAIIVTDEQVTEHDLRALSAFREMTGNVVHCLFDENVEPLVSRQNSQPLPFDRWLTLNSALEKWGRSKGLDVLRIPDYLPLSWFSPKSVAGVNSPCRVVCPLFSLTGKERDFIYQMIEKTHHIVDWYIFGDCPASWNPLVKGTFKYHANPVSVETLDALAPDAVVLFRDNNHEHRFAESYSVLQYAARDIAVICSDFPCFSEYDFVTKLKPKIALWTAAIEGIASTRNPASAEHGKHSNRLKMHYLFDETRQQELLAMLR